MTPQEPFDARDIEEIAGVDALFDRLGARAPSPDDLDDPVVAALALMAAEIDLDAVPVDTTRRAVASARSDVDLPGPFAAHDERTGLVIDLRQPGRASDPFDDPAEQHEPDGDPLGGPVPGGGTGEPPTPLRADGAAGRPGQPRRPVRSERRPESGATAMAPPRSLPRSRSTRPGPGHPGDARRHRLRPATAAVIAVAAIVLGSAVSAAVTGGRSVNPLAGIQQVVAVLTGHRTAQQQQAYDAALQQLRAARAAVSHGQKASARVLLSRIDLGALAPDDAKAVRQQVAEVQASAGG